MIRIVPVVVLIVLATLTLAQDGSPGHPNLSPSLRAFIDSLDKNLACDLPRGMTVEVESLLQWEFDWITVQTEADELLDVYVRCVPPDRAAPFLVDVHSATEVPLARYYLLRGLAATGHKVAIDLLIEQASSSVVYATLESTHGGGVEHRTIGQVADRLLSKLFPLAAASSPQSWAKWWVGEKDDFIKVRGLPYN